MHKAAWFVSLISVLLFSFDLLAQTGLKVAVASNFTTTAELLISDFEAKHNITVVPLVGSTGKHAAQIQRGLPVDVFLAADKRRPQWLIDNGFAVEGSRLTYALGRLVLFSNTYAPMSAKDLVSRLPNNRVAIANPALAPYGVAAIEFLDSQNFEVQANPQIIKGESVAQAYQFAASGAVELALIAYSQVILQQNEGRERPFYLVPSTLHQPIEQQAVMIRESSNAASFMTYLKSPAAQAIIKRSGYEIP